MYGHSFMEWQAAFIFMSSIVVSSHLGVRSQLGANLGGEDHWSRQDVWIPMVLGR